MTPTRYALVAILLVGVQAGYLRLARHMNLTDRPNERSSHTDPTTIRGGGILFFVAALAAFVYSGFAHPYFFAGLTVVAFISFLDDIRPIPSWYRLGAQAAGIALLLHETGLLTHEMEISIGLLIAGVGILNAYNFMDGINGMTALHSLVTVGTLWFWQWQFRLPLANEILSFAFIALLIFGYLNVRRQAVCFAGDVGSLSIAFIMLLPLIQTIARTETYLPVLMLAVYGVDTILTILHRLYHRQNIFRAHRLHLFQLLVHRLNWPHLRVSTLYALVQLMINVVIAYAIDWSVVYQWLFAGAVLTALAGLYGWVRQRLMSR